MHRNTSLVLGNYFESFIENKTVEDKLKNAIQEGIDSGIGKKFNPKKHLENLKAHKKKNSYIFSENNPTEDIL